MIGRLRAFLVRLGSYVGRERLDRDLADELESHLQLHIDDNLRKGMPPDEARRQALLALGGVEASKERYRERRGIPALDALVQDVRLAWRSLRRAPGFTAAIVLMLGAGMAITVAAFSIPNAVLFRPLPGITEQKTLVTVDLWRPAPGGMATSYDDFVALRDGMSTLEGLAAFHEVRFAASVGGDPISVPGVLVTSNYFDVLRTPFSSGRAFTPDEDLTPGAKPAVVISHGLWQQYFDSDPAAVGREILVNNTPMPIAGVAPPGFRGIGVGRGFGDMALWVPLAMAEIALRDADGRAVTVEAARSSSFSYVGRLAPGATIEQAQSQALAVAQGIAATDPGREGLVGGVRSVGDSPLPWHQLALRVAVTMAVPLIVLAIACINAANLLLARATWRAREWALRAALGATAPRLVRAVLVECLLISLAAAALGLVLAIPATTLMQRAILPPTYPPLVIDLHVALSAAAAAMITAVAFGLAPALRIAARATGAGPTAARLSGAGRTRGRLALVAVQVALSLALLAPGWQLVDAVRVMEDTRATGGMRDADRVLALSFDVDRLQLPRVSGEDFYERLIGRTRALPEVRSVVLTNGLAIAGGAPARQTAFRMWPSAETPPDGLAVDAIHVEGDLLDALDLPLVHGRSFLPADRAGVPRHVLANQAFADQVFDGQALGRTFEIAAVGQAARHPVTIVGVIASGPGTLAGPKLFLPSPVAYAPARTMYVRFRPGARMDAALLDAVVRDIDPRVPMEGVATAAELLARRDPTTIGLVRTLLALGILALLLSAAGLFGLLSYVVSMRAKEIGVRAVLGADRRSVLRLVLRQAAAPVAIGIVAGAGGTALLAAIVRVSLPGVPHADPLAFAGASLVLILTMAAACAVPARRAASVDPLIVLREE